MTRMEIGDGRAVWLVTFFFFFGFFGLCSLVSYSRFGWVCGKAFESDAESVTFVMRDEN